MMVTGLDNWLRQATRNLAKDSAAQVRREIAEHYEAALDAAIASGASSDEAGRLALNALGDAKTANRQYCRVLLTSAEARILREGNWEAKAFCSRPWLKWMMRLKWMMLAIPVAVILAIGSLFTIGRFALAQDILICGIGVGPVLAMPFLPIYTRSRSRVFRIVRWVAMTGALLLLFGPEALKWSWLLLSCLWPLAWTEWTRASIRRKLPIAAWPKHLYF